MTADASTAAPVPEGPIVARAGQYYRVTRYIMTFILFLYGGWSIYDGFISWPNWPISHPDEKPKTPVDILFNKVLGCALPPGGILLLVRCLYNSRGEYRLEGGILKVPGYPPVPLDKIQTVDRELWDRKGIAYVEYHLPPGSVGDPKKERGEFILDDFVYEREPTDAIFSAIEASLMKGHPAPAAPAEPKPAAVAKAQAPRPAAVAPAAARPAPAVAKPAAVARPASAAQPAPIAKPAPISKPAPSANPAPMVRPTPTAKPAPIAKPASPAKPPAPGAPPAYPKTPPRPRL